MVNELVEAIVSVLTDTIPKYTGGVYRFYVTEDSTNAFADLKWEHDPPYNGAVYIHGHDKEGRVIGFTVYINDTYTYRLPEHLPITKRLLQQTVFKEVCTGVFDMCDVRNDTLWLDSMWNQSPYAHRYQSNRFISERDEKAIGILTNLPNLWHCNVRGY